MINNPVQFAVVREDPSLEIDLVSRIHAKKVLLIGSGGCTALSLQSVFPELRISLLEPNINQINLIEKKVKYLQKGNQKQIKKYFNIATENQTGLNQCGNFESLFRGFRNFIHDFITSKKDLKRSVYKQMPLNRFWKVAFEMYFSDAILEAIFGKEAIQHAPKGSYSNYFRSAFEKAIEAEGAETNYFLHHILLGHYIDSVDCLPIYLRDPPKKFHFEFIHGYFDSVETLQHYDLVQLSNIFDWMPENKIAAIAHKINSEMKVDAILLFRQLNNKKNISKLFQTVFTFNESLEKYWLERDRSFFYSKINIGVKHA